MDSRLRVKIIIVSLLLHVLFFVLWEAGIIMDLFGEKVLLKPAEDIQPIVLDLQQPLVADAQQAESEQAMPREVIETPEDAKVVEKQDKANFLSDKNALARNPETNLNLPLGEPFSRGDLNAHELPQPEVPRGKPQEPPTPPTPDNGPTDRKPMEKEQKTEAKDSRPEDSVARVIQRPQEIPLVPPKEQKTEAKDSGSKDSAAGVIQRPREIPLVSPGIQGPPPTVRYDNQESRAEDMGGLSFNTYKWDFAPYMLMLKHRIQNNIFPPAAFSQLGIIDGETLLRFKIFPNGQMKDLEILKYKGHESLMLTSQSAVVSSSPFPGLPKDFPEPYLEVTGKFIYFVRR